MKLLKSPFFLAVVEVILIEAILTFKHVWKLARNNVVTDISRRRGHGRTEKAARTVHGRRDTSE